MRPSTLVVLSALGPPATAFVLPATRLHAAPRKSALCAPALRAPAPRACDVDDCPSEEECVLPDLEWDVAPAAPEAADEIGAPIPEGEDCPSEVDCDLPDLPAYAAEVAAPSPPPNAADETERYRLKAALLGVAAASSRGESAVAADLSSARNLAYSLEGLNPTPAPARSALCAGTWELVFADTQLFRSSPFFMAGRAVCADGAEAERYDWFCDMHRAALAVSTIGKVRQVISADQIVSEFEVRAGAVPFIGEALPALGYSGGLPLTINGALVSTAAIDAVTDDGYALLMDTVEVKGSNVPGLRQALDAGLRLQTRALGGALQQLLPEYANPTPLFRVTYLDEALRIGRDQDDKLFVYQRVSAQTAPTDYAAVPADLGLGQLLQGVASTLLG